MTIDPEVLGYYEQGGEASRLRGGVGRLEFWRTQDVLRRVLPPAPARVLDIGGGTGVHAEWLAAEYRAADTGLMVSPREGGFRGFFHDPGEILGEFADAGLGEPARYGLEGAFWLYGDIDVWLDDDGRRELLLDAARRLESEPSLLGVSGHLLAVATRG